MLDVTRMFLLTCCFSKYKNLFESCSLHIYQYNCNNHVAQWADVYGEKISPAHKYLLLQELIMLHV